MPREYRQSFRRDADQALSQAGFLARAGIAVLSEMVYNAGYRLYECPSCGASVLFLVTANRIKRCAQRRSCGCSGNDETEIRWID